MGEWVVGAFINLFGSIAINFGTNLLKLGHNERERHSILESEGASGKLPLKPIIHFQTWRVGFLFFVLGNCLNFISFGYAAQSLLAALGSIQFISNIAFAYFVLNKMVTVKVMVATAFIVLGNIFLVAFGNHQSPVYTPEQLAEKYSNIAFLLYCLILVLVVALQHSIYRRGELLHAVSGQDLRPYWHMLLPFSYAIVSGAVGSFSVLFAKSLSNLLRLAMSSSYQLHSWFTYSMLLLFLSTAGFWMARLNEGLSLFDAILIVPMFQIAWTFFSICTGFVYFQEYQVLNRYPYITPLLLSRSPPPSNPKKEKKKRVLKDSKPPPTKNPHTLSLSLSLTHSTSLTTTTMEPPPAAPSLQPHHPNYADSVDSSPRSRNTDSWDEPLPPTTRLRLMCSYGGHIVPRPHDKSLCYVGGDTRIVVVDRHTSLSDLSNRLSKTLLNGRPFTLKYQLPSEDLDSLISVTTDEDLDNMIDEYDRTATNNSNSSSKPSRLRLFLFPLKPESTQSMGPILDMPATKSEDWFLNALNGASGMLNRGFSDSASVNCLLGLDDDGISGGAPNNLDSASRDAEATIPANCKNAKQGGGGGQDVHSVPDSPMLENSSSFGSTSSSPSLANLPPIRVHVEDGGGGGGGIRVQDQKMGIEEQFAQMTVGGGGQKQDEGSFVVLSPPPPMPTTIVASAAPLSSATEYLNRVVSDDERSDHGAPAGYRRPPQPQLQLQPQTLPAQSQPKSIDLPSPDSVSSDSSFSNASRPKPVIYQDPVVQIPSGNTRFPANLVDPKLNMADPNTRVQMQQQLHDSGYVLQAQFDHQQQQQQQQQHQQAHQQHQQAQQQQQFIHAGTHYIQHHPGSVPIPAYYPVYPSQQQQHHQHHHHPQLDQQQQQQYQVYYMPARQAQPYTNLPVQQSNINEAATSIPSSRSQTPPNSAMVSPSASFNQIRNAQIAKPDMAGGVYRTATAAAPSVVQVPPQHQQQYVGYTTQIHQSAVPSSGGAANYAYEYAEPSHAQIYYTQPLAPAIPSQYQTMTAAAAMVLPEGSAQLPTDNIKQQR